MSRKEDPAPATRFEFITIDNPSQATSALVRRQVRSHVTELQHRKKNESKTSRIRFAHDSKKAKSKPKEKQITQRTDRIELPSIHDLTNPLAAAFARGSLAFQLYTLNDSENVVGKILSHMGTDALGLLRNYEYLVLSQTPEFERQYSDIATPGSAYRSLFPEIFRDPALLSACMLLSLSQMTASMPQPVHPHFTYYILQLRGHVIREINLGMQDNIRRMGDHLVVAILLLATCEALHGLRKSYPIHMVGLMNLVNHRGGLRALGSNGSVEGFILWQDKNIANIVGGQGYSHLAENPTRVHDPKPDKEHFLWGAAVNAKTETQEESANGFEDEPAW